MRHSFCAIAGSLRAFMVAVSTVAAMFASLAFGAQPAHAASNEVLILGSTVTGGASSAEASEVVAKGLTPVVVDDATWKSMTTSQFASYKAIVIGDPTCSEILPDAAVSTAKIWGPAVSGNTIIIGTDPVYHGKTQVINQAMDFAMASDTGKTGAYLDLSCNYDNQPTPVDAAMLDGLRGEGAFTTHTAQCYNDAHIVATHPALDALTDAYMSGWSCSVHEVLDTWPGDFQVLAIAKDYASTYTASDGTVGAPYILASGSGLHSFPLSLDPTSQSTNTGSPTTVTAQLLDSSTAEPVGGRAIAFRVSVGPNAGITGTCSTDACKTDADGHVSWTYTPTSTGSDTVQAWLDTNSDGSPSSGEPQTTAGVSVTAAASADCNDAIKFVSVRGSGQTSSGIADLTASAETSAVYNAMRSVLPAGTSTGFYQLPYPALGVEVMTNGVSSAGSIGAAKNRFFSNVDTYLSGKDDGVAALGAYMTRLAFTFCPSGHRPKVVLAGYSQGAMVVHDYLSQLARDNATGYLEMIAGVALIADGDRVPNSRAHNFGTAADRDYGVCHVIDLLPGDRSCDSPYQIPDVSESVRNVWQVCDYGDIVCDTSTLFSFNTLGGYRAQVRFGTSVHTGYCVTGKRGARCERSLTTAGQAIGRRALK